MRIIVEGPDGGGKSRLVGYLSVHFKELDIVRNGMGPDQDLQRWWPAVLAESQAWPIVPIHDRFFYSELIYGPILRGHIKVEPPLCQIIQKGLRQEALLIYARPDRATLELGVREESQMEGVTDKFTELVEAYDRLMSVEAGYYGRRFYMFDWLSTNEPRQVVEHVQRYLTGGLE